MGAGEGDCCVVVVGAGAAGALTASHLVTGLSSRYRVVLVDPAPTTGRGAAYSTSDERHLLNVPASGMSAFPRDPEHFFRWVRTHHDPLAQPQDFVPRRVYGDYVHSLLLTASGAMGAEELKPVPPQAAATGIQMSTVTVSREPADFLQAAAAAVNIPFEELRVLDKPGMGKIEMLVLIVLHEKSNVDLKSLVRQRKSGMRLSRIIQNQHQDERQIYQEAWQLRKKIDEK